MKSLAIALAGASLGLVATLAGAGATPASAQGARDRVLVIYGDDKCPTSNGEEIVICARKPESERYRIPEELRTPGSSLPPTWADKAQSLEYVGRTGVDSCSTNMSGTTGCFRQLSQQARAERKAAAAAERREP